MEDIGDVEVNVASRVARSDGSGGRELVPNGEGDEEDCIGGGGAGELLSTPNVKTVLFLGCAVQVRRRLGAEIIQLHGDLSV